MKLNDNVGTTACQSAKTLEKRAWTTPMIVVGPNVDGTQSGNFSSGETYFNTSLFTPS